MALRAKNLTTGAVVADRVGVAATRGARAVGLLNRNGLEPGEGLWIVPSRGVHTCWMRFAIDVIALDDDGVVIDRVANLKPWRERHGRGADVAADVEELAGAVAAQVGEHVAVAGGAGAAGPPYLDELLDARVLHDHVEQRVRQAQLVGEGRAAGLAGHERLQQELRERVRVQSRFVERRGDRRQRRLGGRRRR